MLIADFVSTSCKIFASATKKIHHESDVAVAPAKTQLKPPSKYKVILLNDDFTTMDFVIDILQKFFSMSQEQATHIMLEVHTRGKAVCGIYSKDVAETKAQQVNQYARKSDHPLLCKTEKMD